MSTNHHERAAEALNRFRETRLSEGCAEPAIIKPKGSEKPGAIPNAAHVTAPGHRSKVCLPNDESGLSADLRAHALLSRERLIRRWGCGSNSTFHRAERDGLLVPRRDGSRTGYTWADVFAFEGGQPPEGLEDDYREDLLTERKVAALSTYAADTIIQKARRGEIPHRRIGRFYRFVRAEVLFWIESWS